MLSKLWGIAPLLMGVLLPVAGGAAVNEAQSGTKDGPEIFSPRDRHASVVFDDRMWVIGGSGTTGRMNDVWSSQDGINWVEETPAAGFSPRRDHSAIVLGARMWVIGGEDSESALSDVWSSEDGVTWVEETSDAAFGQRYGHRSLAFDGRMWVIGGDGTNSVLSSEDGVTWTQTGTVGGFDTLLGLTRHAAVVHDGAMWVTGGQSITTIVPYFRNIRDVNRSEDGAEWSRIIGAIADHRDHAMLSFKDRMWVLTGSSVRSTEDAMSWESHTWSPPRRINHTALVFRDRMWVIGGSLVSDRMNDVWSSADGSVWTEGPMLHAEPSSREVGHLPTVVSVTVRNSGHGVLEWSAAPAEGNDWFSVSPASGTLGSDESADLTITIERNPTTSVRQGLVVLSAPGATASPREVSIIQQDAPETDPDAIFSPRRGHTAEVFHGRIWLLAGRDESGRRSDVWSSPDGTHWVEETASAAFPARSGHGSAVMNGRLWIFGGQNSDGEPMNDVWSSANGVTWEQEAASAGFPPRFDHAVAPFDGRLWIIGGLGDAGRLNDVWSSADGVTWEMATQAAPFPPRRIHEAVGFAGRLWVLGGDAQDLPYNRDVWSSADGVDWRQEDASPVFSGRGGHSAVVLNDRLWVLAGASGPVMPFFPQRDVWSSSDGISWELINSQAPFNTRSQHASVVFDGRMWVIGGFQGGTRYGIRLYNDVWSSADGVVWDRAVPLVPAVPAWIAHPASSETGTIVVEWAESEFADSYELQRSRDAGPWVSVYTGPGTESQDSVGHGRYRYRVRACSIGVCSEWRTGAMELDVPFNFRDYIEFAYLTALDREPEAGAVDLWDAGYFHYFFVQGDLGIRLMPQDVGRMILLSPEYEGRGRTCEEFIGDLYLMFLFREASQGELEIWCGGEPGWNRAEAMSIVARSQEARENFEALFPGRQGEPLRDFVGAMYAGTLDRLPEHGGLEAWTSTFPAQPGPEQRQAARFMTGTLFDSAEFQGNLPQDEVAAARKTVVHLYRTFMNRYPMTPEIDFWAGELLAGEWTLEEVIDYFAASEEFSNRLAEYFGG